MLMFNELVVKSSFEMKVLTVKEGSLKVRLYITKLCVMLLGIRCKTQCISPERAAFTFMTLFVLNAFTVVSPCVTDVISAKSFPPGINCKVFSW